MRCLHQWHVSCVFVGMQELLSAGCVFEVAHGWECPSWFLTSGTGSGALPETQIAKVSVVIFFEVFEK